MQLCNYCLDEQNKTLQANPLTKSWLLKNKLKQVFSKKASQGKPAGVHHTDGNSCRQMKRRDAALWLHVSRMFYFSRTEVS